MNFFALLTLLCAVAWLVVLVRAASRGTWWVAALYAGTAAGLADLFFVLFVLGDQPEYRWLVPWSGIAFVAALLALLSKNVRAVWVVGAFALVLGSAWGFVALRDVSGGGGAELVWWAGLVAMHLMTFDAARRHTLVVSRAPYEQAFD